MRKIVILLALPILLLLPTASATTPTAITGTFTFTSDQLITTETTGPNTLVTSAITLALTGGLSGTIDQTSTALTTAQGLTVDVGQTRLAFTGIVDGASGTLLFASTANTAGGAFHGHFTILSGTGGLANLHGEGTFSVTSPSGGTYTLQVNSI